jgi:hypothetical protein
MSVNENEVKTILVPYERMVYELLDQVSREWAGYLQEGYRNFVIDLGQKPPVGEFILPQYSPGSKRCSPLPKQNPYSRSMETLKMRLQRLNQEEAVYEKD